MSNQNSTAPIRLITGKEVAKILNVSRSYAYLLMKQGVIPTVRIGRTVRVSYENLLELIENNTVNTKAH